MRGVRRLFYNLSLASKKVEARRLVKERLQEQLQKIKIVSRRYPRKTVLAAQITKLEKHISEAMGKKAEHEKIAQSQKEREALKTLHQKEKQLNEKIAKLNDLLAQVGKKVNEKKLLQQLEEPSLLEELEHKLYALEAKYHLLKEDPRYSEEALASVSEKISLLKERIRELRNRS